MRRSVLGLTVASVVAAILMAASPAHADDATEQARVYFDAGAQAYAAGRYPVAIEAFDAAYRLAARPAILFSMAQAERKQFSIDKKPDALSFAIKHYRAYLAQVPTGGRRDDAATALAELEPAAARLGVIATDTAPLTAPPVTTKLLVSSQATNARATIDGEAPAPLPRLVNLPAGKHHVAVTADGYYDDARDVVILAGVTTPVELNLREQPALLTVEAETGSTVGVDGRAVGDVPMTKPVEVSSGHHTVTVSKNGRQLFHEEVTLDRGRSKTVIAPLVITRQRRISEVTLAVGGVGVVTGLVFLGVAFGEQATATNIHDQRQTQNITNAQLAQYNSALAARDTWRTASLATMGSGLAVLAVGGALFLFDHPTGEAAYRAEPSRGPGTIGPAGCGCTVEVSVIPAVSPTFGGAGVVGRF